MMAEHDSWKAWGVPAGEPVPGQSYHADGWSYHPAPPHWITKADFDMLQAVIGPENMHILNFVDHVHPNGTPIVKAEFLVSPLGRLCLRNRQEVPRQ